jgi:hypothetical protein
LVKYTKMWKYAPNDNRVYQMAIGHKIYKTALKYQNCYKIHFSFQGFQKDSDIWNLFGTNIPTIWQPCLYPSTYVLFIASARNTRSLKEVPRKPDHESSF